MAVDSGLLVVIKSAGLGGDDEPDLGEKLMKAFLNTLLESGRMPAEMIFMKSGIFLTTEGSPVIDILKKFEDEGSRIFSCGTCLDYYGRREKLLAGEPGNMKATVRSMLEYSKVLSP